MSISIEEINDLLYCSRTGDLEAFKGFFELCGNEAQEILVKIVDSESGNSALHMASANGHEELVTYLVDLLHGYADEKKYIDLQNENGNTALHWAALNGHLEIVKVLCEQGQADPFVKNNSKHDAFYEADNNEKESVIDYLLEKYSFNIGGDEAAETTDEPIAESSSSAPASASVATSGSGIAQGVEDLALEDK